ncbi:hypothetical protein DPMN_091691 [Dreissena polymorpha]|uniref:Uncharacterized protein n=1 Tax=Dreissena polymorpha TaxID=45954 RepID=A0A9D4KZZ2_DREPO|nr:hypothetical protein DPMN_091691 [Dreissena polymorpha]
MIDNGTSGIGGVMAEKGENPRSNLKGVHACRSNRKAEVDTKCRLANPASVINVSQLFRDTDCKVCSRQWRHPYNCDAEILFGYAGNIVFYNIVSVSIDVIAYERFNAENCSMKERLTTSSFPAMSRSGSAEMWIGCDETEIF